MMLDAEDIYFMFAIFNIASGIGVLFVQLYLVFFELENIFAALPNSYGAELRKPFLNGGVFSKIFVVGNIAMMLCFHKRSIKGGDLSQYDYDNFPSKIKFQLQAMHLVSLFLGVMMLVLFALGKYMGWLK